MRLGFRYERASSTAVSASSSMSLCVITSAKPDAEVPRVCFLVLAPDRRSAFLYFLCVLQHLQHCHCGQRTANRVSLRTSLYYITAEYNPRLVPFAV